MANANYSNVSRPKATLLLHGPDMPGLLKASSAFVSGHGGNITKAIAYRFADQVVVFVELIASADSTARMRDDMAGLIKTSRCEVHLVDSADDSAEASVYGGALQKFRTVTDDEPGLLTAIADIVETCGMNIVGHVGELCPIPTRKEKTSRDFQVLTQYDLKMVVQVPLRLDYPFFNNLLDIFVKKYNGTIIEPLGPAAGLI